MSWYTKKNDELFHYGIKGMQWGVRRFQNEDGSLTPAGKQRYSTKEYKRESWYNSSGPVGKRAASGKKSDFGVYQPVSGTSLYHPLDSEYESNLNYNTQTNSLSSERPVSDVTTFTPTSFSSEYAAELAYNSPRVNYMANKGAASINATLQTNGKKKFKDVIKETYEKVKTAVSKFLNKIFGKK